MPVTRLNSSPVAPAAPAAPPPPAAMPADGPVGHGTTRLMARSRAYAANPLFVPGAPPPTQETAGANKGRISIR